MRARTDSILVAGSIGPLGVMIEPIGALGTEEAEELFARQASVLADAGADLLILETFVDVGGAEGRHPRRAYELRPCRSSPA